MTLNTHLELGSPLIWVNSDEPERVVDEVILQTKRDVYQLDPFTGLVVWRDDKWVKVLVKNQEGVEGTTHDFNVSFMYVFENQGIMIIPNAHTVANDFLAVFLGLQNRYRNSYRNNSADDLPCQLVMISCTGEIPPEIMRSVAIVNHELPGPEDLAEIIISIKEGIGSEEILPDSRKQPRIINSAIGLSEAEFMQSCLLSIKEHNLIDPDYVNNFKMEKIKSGGVLEIRNSKISLDQIGGLDNAKEIINSIVWAWNNPEEVAKFEIRPIRRLLMIGVPGTGKSAICEATASSLNLELAKFGVSSMMDKFIGESERKMRTAFKQIRAMAPLVIWADELGRDLSGSGTANDSGTTDRVHGEFLTGLQELPDNVLFMAAANRIDGIPPEMLRAERFDKIMFVGFPSLSERMDIFKIFLRDRVDEFNLDDLAQVTTMFTGAEIRSLIEETKFTVSTKHRRHIQQNDLLMAAPEMKNRIWVKRREEVINMYKKAAEEWDWASSQQRIDADYILGKPQKVATGSRLVTGF